MENMSDMQFFAVFKESSKFLRPRLIHSVVLGLTHFMLVHILVHSFNTLLGGLMKSSVSAGSSTGRQPVVISTANRNISSPKSP